jgi:hypothetical protein
MGTLGSSKYYKVYKIRSRDGSIPSNTASRKLVMPTQDQRGFEGAAKATADSEVR